MTYKALFNLAPSYICKFISISDNKRYNLRSISKGDLKHARPKTGYLKQSFKIIAMQTWNSIPENIRQSISLNSFKNQYKYYLFNKYHV